MDADQPLINLEFALNQLSGNSELLFKMLQKFRVEFSKVPEQVRTLVDKLDVKEAKLKVHTTKGLSGNLGLMALFESSKQLDQSLRAGNIDYDLIDNFERIVKQTCEEIDKADLVAPDKTTFSNHQVKDKYKAKLIEQLNRNEFIDDDTLHKYVDSLTMTSEQKLTLTNMVEDLDYDAAIAFINQHS